MGNMVQIGITISRQDKEKYDSLKKFRSINLSRLLRKEFGRELIRMDSNRDQRDKGWIDGSILVMPDKSVEWIKKVLFGDSYTNWSYKNKIEVLIDSLEIDEGREHSFYYNMGVIEGISEREV